MNRFTRILIVACIMMLAVVMMALPSFAQEANTTASGEITYGYVSSGYINGVPAIWGDATFNASESFVVKIYAGDKLIATTTLNDPDHVLTNGTSKDTTWHAAFSDDGDSWWTTVWKEGCPNTKDAPDKVVLYVDGVEVSSKTVKMSSPDDLNPVRWRYIDGVTITDLAGEGTEESPYLIETLAELKWFRDTVNTYTQDGSNQFKGKYIKLTADIDLFGENWTPIGTNSVGDHMAFLGIFDGDGHTISNLYINADGDHLGFFARTSGSGDGSQAVVKNVTFNNVDVSSSITTGHGGSYVGGIIANSGGNTLISNVKVTGDVYVVGYGYVGGIVGHGYPDIYNCSVEANDGSYIQGYYWCVGGIVGYAGENGTLIQNASVSGVDIWSAYGAAAAIAGLLQYGNKLENVSAENVEITSASDYVMGYIAGNGEESTLTNCYINNVTATANGKGITITDAVAKVGDKIYFDLHEAFYENRGEDELVVTLIRDVTYDASLTAANSGTVYVIENGEYVKKNVAQKVTLDLNGKTFTSTVTDDAAIKILNGASLTITNGKIVASGDGIKVGGGGSAATLIVDGGAIEANGVAVNVTKNSILTLNDGTVKGGSYGAVLGGDNAKIYVNGGTLTGVGAITSNSAYSNTEVTIAGGTVSGTAVGIYQPQNGTTTISGGIVTGQTAINIKSGSLVITGGTISGTGEKSDYVFTGGGFTPNGDAIVIENAYNYNNAYETPTVSITGGTITSDNGTAVTSYAASSSDSVVTNFISGGTFNTAMDEALAAKGLEFTQDADGAFIVQEKIYTLSDVFTFKGYSTKINGTGISAGFTVDYEALEAYEMQTGKKVSFGSIFTAEKITNPAIINDLTGYKTANVNLIINGIDTNNATHMGANFIMALYVDVDGARSYVSDGGVGDATTITTITYDKAQAREVASTKDDEEE